MTQSAIQALAPRLSEQFTWDPDARTPQSERRIARILQAGARPLASDLFSQVRESLYEWTAERSALALAPMLARVREIEKEERRHYRKTHPNRRF